MAIVRLERLGKFKKKNKSPHRDSNPRPSGLWHSSLTIYAITYIFPKHNIIRNMLHNSLAECYTSL
jgi:hypothetical protein